MKKQLTVCLMILVSLSSFAQEKPMLTKAETINYLNNKIGEVKGEKEPFCSSCSDKIYKAHFVEKNGLIEIGFSYDIGNSEWATTYLFNPAYIETVDLIN